MNPTNITNKISLFLPGTLNPFEPSQETHSGASLRISSAKVSKVRKITGDRPVAPTKNRILDFQHQGFTAEKHGKGCALGECLDGGCGVLREGAKREAGEDRPEENRD
jgi:hypothetical protein